MGVPFKQPIKHGTSGGYRVHKGRGETACQPCTQAHNAELVEYRSYLITCKECGQEKRRYSQGRCGMCASRISRAKAKKKKGVVA